jgi:NADPH:quinone reductase-like Zn-dependent oxidoreductase
VHGIYVGSRRMFDAMNRALAAADLHPVIDRTFGFEQARDAYRHMQAGAHFGKIVVTL